MSKKKSYYSLGCCLYFFFSAFLDYNQELGSHQEMNECGAGWQGTLNTSNTVLG